MHERLCPQDLLATTYAAADSAQYTASWQQFKVSPGCSEVSKSGMRIKGPALICSFAHTLTSSFDGHAELAPRTSKMTPSVLLLFSPTPT